MGNIQFLSNFTLRAKVVLPQPLVPITQIRCGKEELFIFLINLLLTSHLAFIAVSGRYSIIEIKENKSNYTSLLTY